MRNEQCKMIAQAKRLIVLALLLVGSVGGCGGDSTDSGGNETLTTAETATGTRSQPPQMDRKHPVVRIETNQGELTIRLDAVRAPVTVRNFLNYAADGFYDNTIVHYVDPGKIILAGGY